MKRDLLGSTESAIASQSFPPTDDQMKVIEAKMLMRRALMYLDNELAVAVELRDYVAKA